MPNKKTSKSKARTSSELESLALGEVGTKIPTDYAPEALESFPSRRPEVDAWTSFHCMEFTSLCPKTGQPDFARITINYLADKKMVESKSLKLYLFSFRNHGSFHEDCIQTICDDLVKLMKPRYIEVIGEFTPRGGIAIHPYASTSNSNQKYKNLRTTRFNNYSPGAYTLPLSRIYGG